MIFVEVARRFVVTLFVINIPLSLSNSVELSSSVKYWGNIFRSKENDTFSSDDVQEATIFSEVFPELQNVKAYVFEYKQGERIAGDELLMWETKSWKFEKQDVSLQITFPNIKKDQNTKYYITHYRAFICQDAVDSHGFLISGGIGMSDLDLKFVTKLSSYLSYDFKIFVIDESMVKNHTDIFGDP